MRRLFIHVPKTAGTSLYRMLMASLPEEERPWNPRVTAPVARTYFQPGHKGGEAKFAFGHFHYREWMRADFDWIGTVLRDPVHRLWSLYHHARQVDNLEVSRFAQGTFKDFLLDANAVDMPQVSNWQVRQLAGCGGKTFGGCYVRARAALASMDYIDVAYGERTLFDVLLAARAQFARWYYGDDWFARVPALDVLHERKGQPPGWTAEERRIAMSLNHFDTLLCQDVLALRGDRA